MSLRTYLKRLYRQLQPKNSLLTWVTINTKLQTIQIPEMDTVIKPSTPNTDSSMYLYPETENLLLNRSWFKKEKYSSTAVKTLSFHSIPKA